MRKALALLLAVSLLVGMAPLALAQEEPLELTLYYPVNVDGPLVALIEQICADFTAENPDIIVTPIYTGNYDDNIIKLQTSFESGTQPDLVINLGTNRFSMVYSDYALCLDDLIASDGGDEYINDFVESFMIDSYVDGKIYSIPFQRSVNILYYNKDMFAAAGLDPDIPPTTWEELVEYAQKLTLRDESGNTTQWGIALGLSTGSAQWTFTGLALQNSLDGSGLATEDGKTVLFNTPENVEALQFVIDLQQKYKVMQEGIIANGDLPTMFTEGLVAMIENTTGGMTSIASSGINFGVAMLPGPRRNGAPTGGGNIYICNGISEERQKAAWSFIRFATDPERVAQWCVDTGYVVTRYSAMQTQTYKTYLEEWPQAAIGLEALKYAAPELTVYDCAKIWRIFNDYVQAAIIGEMSAQEAMDAAQEEATQALSKYQ